MDFSSNWVCDVWMGLTWKEVGYLSFLIGSFFSPRPCAISNETVGEIHSSRETRRKFRISTLPWRHVFWVSRMRVYLTRSFVLLAVYESTHVFHRTWLLQSNLTVRFLPYFLSLHLTAWSRPPMIIPRAPFRFLIRDWIIRGACFDCRCTSVKLSVFYRFTLLRNLASCDKSEVTFYIILSLKWSENGEFTIRRPKSCNFCFRFWLCIPYFFQRKAAGITEAARNGWRSDRMKRDWRGIMGDPPKMLKITIF